MSIADRLRELNITLPEPPRPVAAYIPAVRTGNLLFISGQLPMEGGQLRYAGKVPADVTPEHAYAAARLATINALAVARGELGSLDRVTRVVRVIGHVASAPGFTGQPAVVNGASELLGEVFGERGRHSRAALGAAELPLGACVEIELILEVD
jgi:enamine deaminase RidA (YjgF/YER057c/UK114 family)